MTPWPTTTIDGRSALLVEDVRLRRMWERIHGEIRTLQQDELLRALQLRRLAVGLYGSWPMNGDALDNSGQRNDLTNAGAVSFVPGKVLQAASYSGSTAQGLWRPASATTSSLQVGDIDFAFSAWVKFASLAASRAIAAKFQAGGAQRAWQLFYLATNNRIRFQVSADGSAALTTLDAESLGAPEVGKWYFVTAWHDATNNLIGLQVGTETELLREQVATHGGGVFASSAAFVVGAAGQSPVFVLPMSGLVDTPLWWRRVLTAKERRLLWNSGAGREYPF